MKKIILCFFVLFCFYLNDSFSQNKTYLNKTDCDELIILINKKNREIYPNGFPKINQESLADEWLKNVVLPSFFEYAKTGERAGTFETTEEVEYFMKNCQSCLIARLSTSERNPLSEQLGAAFVNMLFSSVFLGGDTGGSNSSSRISSGSSNRNSNSQKACSNCRPSNDKGWYITDYVNSRFINGRYIKRPGNKPCSSCHGTADCRAYSRCGYGSNSNLCRQCNGERFEECDRCNGTGYQR
jgi:hypothetical protein